MSAIEMSGTALGALRKQRSRKGSWALRMAILTAVVAVAPLLLYPVFLIKVLCFALFACAFNLLVGFAGLMSFGHAAFFGMGSYISAWTAKEWGLTPELAVLAGGLVGTAMGAAFGWVAIRRQGIFFAMITLALAQMVYFFCLQAPFAGGEDGIQHVPRGRLLGLIPLDNDLAMYGFCAVVFLLGFAVIHRVVHSPFGQILKGIRENETRTASLGYDTAHYKLIAFIVSATFSAMAGGVKALAFGIATLTEVHAATSGHVVLMTLVGGMGTIFGPVVGAFVMTAMEQYLARFGSWVTVIQGLIFIFCVLAFRTGIVGEFNRWHGLWRARRDPAPAGAAPARKSSPSQHAGDAS
ncbi:branched-chain amino acid ABC transporter permease [Bosea sp. (in: a-proteobacteria)]|uniref:branched-chain amino acid ABC transporter permease n=1 Tax=Bosea sp. (in: a-proteobacteria) TaxID=1871050 RepID=UPI002629094D|nr:branched-chain amino acid ABC transporter permease [Bosea sp. (in: a-proteobacteria)]MCO5092930.1 branched-chain amino acid ABC transporter permease [Bosea sp. (in: a-proteobacteria)]